MNLLRLLCSFAAAFLACAAQALAAGSLTVTLSPSAAASAGAQWRVDGGSWRNSGATVKNLSAGTHNVEFKAVSGWIAPASQSATITNGNTTSLTATYVRTASLRITLSPTTGQWRIDGGTWRASGVTVTDLAPGNHTIDYAPLSGYAAPATESVTLAAGGSTTLSRSYTQLAQLSVTLSPATGQWRLDGGAWRASGATVTNLAPGTHTLSFSSLTGYVTPPTESVTLASGSNSLTRTYAPDVGELIVQAAPLPGGAYGRQFIVDGNSAAPYACGSVVTLPAGTHTLTFLPAAGWRVPAPINVTIQRNGLAQVNAQFYYDHRLRFFLHPDLIGTMPMAEVQRRIAQYVEHIRLLIERDTLRRFTFDPVNDIVVTSTNPLSGSFTGELPELGHEFWLYVQLSTNPIFGTYGGNATFDQSGAAGADRMFWDQIYDPSAVPDNSTALMQYWRQIHHTTHEIEHGFGAGLGEYYTLGGLQDVSGVAPLVAPSGAVNGSEPTAFWSAHAEYLGDSLTAEQYGNDRLGAPTTLASVLALSRLAPATIGLANGAYRNFSTWASTLPDMNAVVVRVVDAQTGQLIPGATVRVWNRNKPAPPYDTFEETVTATATPGQFTFRWTGAPLPMNNYENAKVVKAYAPGYVAAGQWTIVYDAQKTKLIDGSNVFVITVALSAQ